MNLDNIYIFLPHAEKVNRLGLKKEVLNIINYFIDYENHFHEYNVDSCRAIIHVFNAEGGHYGNNEYYGTHRLPCNFGYMSMNRCLVFGEYHISISLINDKNEIHIEFARSIPDIRYIKASKLDKLGE